MHRDTDIPFSSQGTTMNDPRPESSPSVPAQRTLSLQTRAVLFTTILLPAALIPFIATRRQISNLNHKLHGIGTTIAALQGEMKTSLLETSVRKEEHTHLRESLQEMRQRLARMRGESRQQQVALAAERKEVRRQIEELRTSINSSGEQLGSLRDLGTSLADIAAFMQEVEVKQGLLTQKPDGRGIERLRRLALQLQKPRISSHIQSSNTPLDNASLRPSQEASGTIRPDEF